MKAEVAIIGAGASGRGFIARLLQTDGAHITFIDSSLSLVHHLNEAGGYTIYLGRERHPLLIDDYRAFHTEDLRAMEAISQADYVFVSVGEQNLRDLVPLLEGAMRRTQSCRIVVCENGIAPKMVLRKALSNAATERMLITQGVIFCTSIPFGSIDILSEDFGELPYDADENLFLLPFPHFVAQKRFDVLLKRKIYTYNCLSACIAYVGYLKGYTDYAAAANDAQISRLCALLSRQLTRVISDAYAIDYAQQEAFAQRALNKFSNLAISDTIYKNARSVIRKLSVNERLIGPMNLFLQMGEDTRILCFITACACAYLRKEETASLRNEGFFKPIDVFLHLNWDMPGEQACWIVRDYQRILGDCPFPQVLDKMMANYLEPVKMT
ncbi:MAG: 2-dehydropantoate 2-reductase N-terminal domain-containing protein [Clostridia bacterium]